MRFLDYLLGIILLIIAGWVAMSLFAVTDAVANLLGQQSVSSYFTAARQTFWIGFGVVFIIVVIYILYYASTVLVSEK